LNHNTSSFLANLKTFRRL